jgi:hypothetical protein
MKLISGSPVLESIENRIYKTKTELLRSFTSLSCILDRIGVFLLQLLKEITFVEFRQDSFRPSAYFV